MTHWDPVLDVTLETVSQLVLGLLQAFHWTLDNNNSIDHSEINRSLTIPELNDVDVDVEDNHKDHSDENRE